MTVFKAWWLYQSELSLQQLRDDGRWPSSQDQTTTSPRDLSVVCRDNFKNVTRRWINSSHWRRRGVPTFVFRAGYARRPAAASPRWPVDDVIVDVPDIHFRLATNVSLFSNGFQNLPAAPHDTLATRVGIRSALTNQGAECDTRPLRARKSFLKILKFVMTSRNRPY
jgi:hypothetical protein